MEFALYNNTEVLSLAIKFPNCFMKLFAILLSLFFISNAHAQDTLHRRPYDTIYTSKSTAIGIGFHAGKYLYGEIGIGRSVLQYHSHGLAGWGISAGSEIQIGKDVLVAPKLSATFSSMGVICGANALYYTDFKNGTFVFRPEIGFGIPAARLSYGYNMRFGNDEMTGISSNMVSVVVFPISLVTKETKSPH